MPRSAYRESPNLQKGKRDYRQVEKSSHDRYYNGQSRKKVHRTYDYPERPKDDQKDRRREPFDDRHKKHQPYDDRPVIRIEPKSVVQVKRSEPVSEIRVHFRFRPLRVKLNPVGEQDLKQKLKNHISQKIGPVAYLEKSANSQPGYLVLELGFRYDGDAFAYLDGDFSQIDITVAKEEVCIEAEPTKTFRLLMNDVDQKKKKPSKHGEREKSRSHSKKSKKEKSKHKRKKSYSESSSSSSSESARSRKSYRSRKSDSRRVKEKDDRNKKDFYDKERKNDRHDDRKNEYKQEKKEQKREDRKEDRKNDYKDDRKEDYKDERKEYRREESRREQPRKQESRRQDLRQQPRKEQYRKEQSKQARRQDYPKQRPKQQYKPRIQQRINEKAIQSYQKQQSLNKNLSLSKLPSPINQSLSQQKQYMTLYFFGIHYSVNSKDMDNLFRKHEDGPFIHQDLIWRQIKDSISVFLEGKFEKKHALKLLEIADKMEVRGHPFVIVESNSIEVDKILQKIAEYQINIQFPHKIEPYHLLKGLKQCGRVVQIISNNKLTDQGRCQYYNVTFNSKQVCNQLKTLKKTSKEIIIEEVTKENAVYIYRPNSETELMTVNYVQENKEDSREREFYSFKESHRDYHKDYHRQGQRDYHYKGNYYQDKGDYYKDKGNYYKDYKDRGSDKYYDRGYDKNRQK